MYKGKLQWAELFSAIFLFFQKFPSRDSSVECQLHQHEHMACHASPFPSPSPKGLVPSGRSGPPIEQVESVAWGITNIPIPLG